VAERDLPVVAGEHVEPEEGDGIDEHLGELEQAEAAHGERQGSSHGEDDEQSADLPVPPHGLLRL
jgi:hypothetical protein